MKTIKLTKGKEALVDDEDYDFLIQWKWQAKRVGNDEFYATRNEVSSSKGGIKRVQKTILMHKVISERMGLFGLVDHRDRNRLNNTRSNLRLANNSQNGANRNSGRNSSSKYLGVHLQIKYSKWIASMTFGGKLVYIGCFSNEIEAAKAYDEKAQELHGEFANLNFPENKKK